MRHSSSRLRSAVNFLVGINNFCRKTMDGEDNAMVVMRVFVQNTEHKSK